MIQLSGRCFNASRSPGGKPPRYFVLSVEPAMHTITDSFADWLPALLQLSDFSKRLLSLRIYRFRRLADFQKAINDLNTPCLLAGASWPTEDVFAIKLVAADSMSLPAAVTAIRALAYSYLGWPEPLFTQVARNTKPSRHRRGSGSIATRTSSKPPWGVYTPASNSASFWNSGRSRERWKGTSSLGDAPSWLGRSHGSR